MEEQIPQEHHDMVEDFFILKFVTIDSTLARESNF